MTKATCTFGQNGFGLIAAEAWIVTRAVPVDAGQVLPWKAQIFWGVTEVERLSGRVLAPDPMETAVVPELFREFWTVVATVWISLSLRLIAPGARAMGAAPVGSAR